MRLALVLLALPAWGQLTLQISSQGRGAPRLVTGYSASTATLARIVVCNQAGADRNVASEGLLMTLTDNEGYPFYSSAVVDQVLATLQQRDVFTRAQKAIYAGQQTGIIIASLFKALSPAAVAVLEGAPAIAAAILPAVVDPRDLIGLSHLLLQDNTSFVLGKQGSGNECRVTLAVAMTKEVRTDTIRDIP